MSVKKRAHPYWVQEPPAWWEKRHPYLRMFTGLVGRVIFGLLIFMVSLAVTLCVAAEVAQYAGKEVPCLCIKS